MHRLDATIAAKAATQHGLVSRRDLRGLGAPDDLPQRRIAAGHWRRAGRGVFVIGGAPSTFHQRVMTAVLGAGPGALASHRTAVRLWDLHLPGLTPIEITIERGRAPKPRGVVTHTSGDVDRANPTLRHGIPVTGLGRSLLDLGAVAPHRVRPAVWAARRTHGIGWDELLRTLIEHAVKGRSGVGPLRRVLVQHYGELATDSATEDIAFALLHDSNVPVPHKQLPVQCADGVWVTADFGWPRRRALLEIQGVDHFTNEDLQQKDLHRKNQLELAGWSVLVYSGQLLREQPDQFVRDVTLLLEVAKNPLP